MYLITNQYNEVLYNSHMQDFRTEQEAIDFVLKANLEHLDDYDSLEEYIKCNANEYPIVFLDHDHATLFFHGSTPMVKFNKEDKWP